MLNAKNINSMDLSRLNFTEDKKRFLIWQKKTNAENPGNGA